MRGVSRKIAIVVGVVLIHLGIVWALQTGLLRPSLQIAAPSEIRVNLIDQNPPEPVVEVSRSKSPLPTVRPATEAVQRKAQSPGPVVQEVPAPLTAPTPRTTAHLEADGAPVTTGLQSPVAQQTVAAKAVELPSSDAQYLSNPRPPYPLLSKRMGEQGRVVIRALIGVDGAATQAVVKQSSGFDRLDQAALATAQSWRYVPGKRAGVPEPMWFDVPFNWVLE